MSTRGFVGFVVEDRETITFNRCDSYPERLGVEVLEYLTQITDWDEMRSDAASLVHVADDDPRNEEKFDAFCARHGWCRGDYTEVPSWCDLLGENLHDPAAILTAGFAVHHPDWPGSTWCDWGYLINLDVGKLEVYSGSNRDASGAGRFDGRNRDGHFHWPVQLRTSWSLRELPDAQTFVATFQTRKPS
ncbi:hypothetical protein [Nocardia sp. NPDC050435]|uniref:hypothetical protein n=1 Tax=Nocardia sp. NPDC050435 TaxID=3155040 RepID=UPI0033D38E9F